MYWAAPRCRKHLIYLRLNYAPAYGGEDAKGETGRAAGPTFATCRHVAEKLIEIWNLFGTVLSDPIFLMKKKKKGTASCSRNEFLNFYFSEEKGKKIYFRIFFSKRDQVNHEFFPPLPLPFLYFNLLSKYKIPISFLVKTKSPRGIDPLEEYFHRTKKKEIKPSFTN